MEEVVGRVVARQPGISWWQQADVTACYVSDWAIRIGNVLGPLPGFA